MKKSILLLIIFFVQYVNAQVPQGIPYQAVARDGQGQPLASTNVKVRFSILDSTATGTAVYVESHSTTTSALGLFTANVGMGTASTGTFSSINWGQNFKFLKVELDTTATGNSYIDLGTQQMMSVPYAMYAGSTLNSQANTINTNISTAPGGFSVVSGMPVPGYLNYFGDCSNGKKTCINNELLLNNSRFCNLRIPTGVTAKINPAETTIIYVNDTLFLDGTIDGSGCIGCAYTANGTTNHIGATSSGAETWYWCSNTIVGGGQGVNFNWPAYQQPSTYFYSVGGAFTKSAGLNNPSASCGATLCNSTDGENMTVNELLKVCHFGLDISGCNGAAIRTLQGGACYYGTYGAGQGGGGLILIANNIKYSGSIFLKGGNGAYFNYGIYCNPQQLQYVTTGAGGGGSCIIRTNNIISQNGSFNGLGGSQTAPFGCNRKGGDGSLIIIK